MQGIQMSIAAASSRFNPEDDWWLSQVELLRQDLAREAELVAPRPVAVPGTKGFGPHDVTVILDAAVVGAVATVITTWLTLDRDRSVHAKWKVNGISGEIKVTSKDIDNPTMQTTVETLFREAIGNGAAETAQVHDDQNDGSSPDTGDEPGRGGGSGPDTRG